MENNFTGATMRYSPRDEEQAQEISQVLREVCLALQEKGYDPLDQIVGYHLSGDPAYITCHRNASVLIRRIDRYQILEELVRFYLGREGS